MDNLKEYEAYKKKVGLNIKQLREKKGLTRENLDEHKYSIPVRTLADIELGTTNPTLKNIWLISKNLDIEVWKLLKVKN
jgi:transcriptional regulator with XRE-family HTH domain